MLSISQGFGETDNVFATPTDRQSQTLSQTALDFGYDRTGSALTAKLNGDFNYLEYLQGAYAGHLFGRFDGQSALSLWQDRLKWTVQDSYGDTQLDVFNSSIVPTNLEHTNLFQTGPDLVLRPLDQTEVKLGARYQLSSYEISPYDGWRSVENAAIQRDLSSASSLSLNAQLKQVHFDNTQVSPDYDNNQYYLEYHVAGALTTVDFSAGASQVSSSDGGWYTTPYLMLNAARQMPNGVSLTLTGGRQLVDATDAFGGLSAGAAGGVIVAPVPGSMDPYVSNFVTAAWRRDGLRTNVHLSATFERDTYNQDDALNVRRVTAELLVSRQFTERFTAQVTGDYFQENYFSAGFRDKNYSARLDLKWQFARTLSASIGYQYYFRSVVGQGYGFDANMGMLTLTYTPIQDGATQDRLVQ